MRAATMAVVILSGACAPGRGEGHPAREAVEACADGAIGARCSFEGPYGPVVGVCDAGADGQARACVARRRPARV
jgi:hypothetical protein